jgi:hypothetical protein
MNGVPGPIVDSSGQIGRGMSGSIGNYQIVNRSLPQSG